MSVTVNLDKCNGCESCIESCPSEAIMMVNGKANIIPNNCEDCGICVDECPVEAIKNNSEDDNFSKQIVILRTGSKASISIPIGRHLGTKLVVKLDSGIKYEITFDSIDIEGIKETFTEVWKYIWGRSHEYQKIRDTDGQVVRIERYIPSTPPRKPGEYIDVLTLDETTGGYERKTFFRRKVLFFWGNPVPYDGPIV
jgi:ferredoxin